MVAISAVATASGAISSAIKAGKDVSSLAGPLKKYARAEAELNFGANRKKNSFLAKFGGAESSAIDKYFKQEELRQARDELRSTFQLYGRAGGWETLQKMIADERVQYREELKKRAEFRDLVWNIIGIIALTITLIAGTLGIFIFAKYLKEQQA